MLRHFGGDLIGNFAFVESIRPLLGNQLQAVREVFLHQAIVLQVWLTVGFVENGATVVVVDQVLFTVGSEIVSQRIVNDDAVARQFDRRRQQRAERQRAVLLRRQGKTGYGSRRAGRQMRSE
ncbi:hypothetical protein E05_45620 [Plautia stali symbiont]|nr:hypothetical protein E05_45620 [Plautia stali symbiont]